MDNFSKSAREDTSTISAAKLQGIKQVGGGIQETTGATRGNPPPGEAGTGINTNAKWLASLELSDAIALWELFKSRVELHPKHRLSPAQVLTLTSLRAADIETVRTGQWYFGLVTCEVADIGSQRQHPLPRSYRPRGAMFPRPVARSRPGISAAQFLRQQAEHNRAQCRHLQDHEHHSIRLTCLASFWPVPFRW